MTRPQDRVVMQLKRWDAKIHSLVKSVVNKRIQPFYTVIKPGGGSHGMYSHDGEEFGFVVKGELELMLNDKIHKVHANRAFIFRHRFLMIGNKGKEDVIVIWVITPPTF